MKIKKGGIETIIGVVILVAIVMGLIIAAVLPMVRGVETTSGTGTNKLNDIWN